VSVAIRALLGQLQPARQAAQDGRQYFMMHPRVLQIASNKYQRTHP
jgi:hypothetical protein